MNKYRLIGWAKPPKRNSKPEQAQEYKMMQRDDDFAIEMLLDKYAVDSDDYIYEDCVSDYVLDEDSDGIYLYYKVEKSKEKA